MGFNTLTKWLIDTLLANVILNAAQLTALIDDVDCVGEET